MLCGARPVTPSGTASQCPLNAALRVLGVDLPSALRSVPWELQ
jgi:hypothetical protein